MCPSQSHYLSYVSRVVSAHDNVIDPKGNKFSITHSIKIACHCLCPLTLMSYAWLCWLIYTLSLSLSLLPMPAQFGICRHCWLSTNVWRCGFVWILFVYEFFIFSPRCRPFASLSRFPCLLLLLQPFTLCVWYCFPIPMTLLQAQVVFCI